MTKILTFFSNQLKWYYDQKTLIFSSDFKTLFTKHSPSEIIGLNFEKTVYFKLQFSDSMTSFTQELWNAMCEHSLLIIQSMPCGLFSKQHGCFELSDSQL